MAGTHESPSNSPEKKLVPPQSPEGQADEAERELRASEVAKKPEANESLQRLLQDIARTPQGVINDAEAYLSEAAEQWADAMAGKAVRIDPEGDLSRVQTLRDTTQDMAHHLERRLHKIKGFVVRPDMVKQHEKLTQLEALLEKEFEMRKSRAEAFEKARADA